MEVGYLGWIWRRSCFSSEKFASLDLHNHSPKAKGPIFSPNLWLWVFASLPLLSFFREAAGSLGFAVSIMATKFFKYFSQMFVVKEREMEIGYPTDVKHVAHIGWDGPSDSAPSWMNEFKNGPDCSTSSLGRSSGDRVGSSNPMTYSPWSSQDFEQSMGRQQSSDLFRDLPPSEVPNVPKKSKRKKVKSSSSSTSRSSRAAKPKATAYTQMEAQQNLLII